MRAASLSHGLNPVDGFLEEWGVSLGAAATGLYPSVSTRRRLSESSRFRLILRSLMGFMKASPLPKPATELLGVALMPVR